MADKCGTGLISGTIELGDILLSPKSNTTIAGQTAPGDGICIKGRVYIGAVSNVVIRYIRIRVDAGAANSSGDAIDIDKGTNIIIEHVSASYARDEGISCQEESNKVTVQWCIISEALTFENHSYGSLVRGDYGDEKTYHHNLYIHNKGRNPRPGNYTAASTDPEGLHFDFRNNVVYNWSGGSAGYNADNNTVSRYNFIGNVYIRGAESSGNIVFRESSVDAFGYFENNSMEGVVPADPWSLVTFQNFNSTQRDAYKSRSYMIPMEPVSTTSPEQAKNDVLALAGASYPKRDIIDTRLVQDVLNKTGRSIATTADQPEGAWPALDSLPASPDDDHDGMPNDWELANNLNPFEPADRNDTDQEGYTMLEVYLNSLTTVETHVDEDVSFIPQDYILVQNYPNPFNPSTTIRFQLPNISYTIIKIYDLHGREVSVLAEGMQSDGIHQLRFDGSGLAAGPYFVRLKAGSYMKTTKILLAK
jgi:pectate lyase